LQTFKSNERYFKAVADLAARLDSVGDAAAAQIIRDGMACINGLTDGWAQFLDAIESVERRFGGRLGAADREELRAIREAAHRAVYRR
jgi:hypothetical protein